MILNCPRPILILDAFLAQVILGEILPHVFVASDRHHLKLSLSPGVKRKRAHLRDVDAEASMQAGTGKTQEHAVADGGPVWGGIS